MNSLYYKKTFLEHSFQFPISTHALHHPQPPLHLDIHGILEPLLLQKKQTATATFMLNWAATNDIAHATTDTIQ